MKVKDICKLINGRAFKPSDWGEAGVPIIRIQNLNDEDAPFNYFAGAYDPVHEVNDGELLFSWSGTPGTSFGAFRWYRGKGVLNQHIFRVIPIIPIDKDYLMHALNGNLNTIISKAHGGVGLQHITKKELDDIEIPVPEISIQLEIVEAISRTKRMVAALQRQLRTFDILIKARFVEMFGDPVCNPMGWEKKKLIQVCTKLTDGTHFSPESFESGTYKYVTAKNIKIDGFDFSNITFIPEEVHRPIYDRCNPEYGDVLYIKDGVTTGVAMVNSLHEEFSLLSSVALLKQNRSIMNGYFLCGVLNNSQMYTSIRMNMGGAAITRLTIAKLNEIQIIVPPIALQERFAAFVSQIDKSKLLHQRSVHIHYSGHRPYNLSDEV